MTFQTMKLKYFCEVKDGTHDTPRYVKESNESIPFVTSKDIIDGDIDFSDTKHISQIDHERFYRRSNVQKGDVLMPMIGTIGNPALVTTNKVFSIKNVALFKTSGDIEKAKYLYYLLGSKYMKRQLDLMKSGGVQSFVSLSILNNLNINVPNNISAMVSFLDKKTREINSLISDKERLIELLEEKRQAIITETVTKGLDPNVKMKDSGIEWIGEIPEHWKVNKLNRVASVIDPEPSHRAPAIAKGEGFPYVGIRDINSDGSINIETARVIEEKSLIEQEKRFVIEDTDIVFCRVATIGYPRIIKKSKRMALSATVALIKHNAKKINHLFLLYYLNSLSTQIQSDLFATGSTRRSLGMETIRKFDVIIPPLYEQEKNARYIQNKSSDIINLKNEIKSTIAKLKEYRESLIYEAVTGKIDLRDYEAESSTYNTYAQVAETKEFYNNND